MNCPVCGKEDHHLYYPLPASFRKCEEHGWYNVLNESGAFDYVLAQLNKGGEQE